MLTESELVRRRTRLYQQDPAIFDHLADFEDRLKASCPDYLKYRFYHVLIGSSLTGELTPIEGDLPGDCSIDLFMRDLEQQLGLEL